MTISLNVNGEIRMVAASPDTPLLYVLRDELDLNAAKYGCGLGQCGACTVHVDDEAVFSCLTPIGAIIDRSVMTLEGFGTEEKPSILQQAFIDEQAAQCGYCTAGMVMRAQVLLNSSPAPSDAEIRKHMQPNLCRCGTHHRIIRAIKRAGAILSTQQGKEDAS